MVSEIRNAELALGTYNKMPTESEKEIMKIARKSIVATCEIEKGAIIRRDMLAIKRPGTGLPSSMLEQIIGKRTKRKICKDELIEFNLVE